MFFVSHAVDRVALPASPLQHTTNTNLPSALPKRSRGSGNAHIGASPLFCPCPAFVAKYLEEEAQKKDAAAMADTTSQLPPNAQAEVAKQTQEFHHTQMKAALRNKIKASQVARSKNLTKAGLEKQAAKKDALVKRAELEATMADVASGAQDTPDEAKTAAAMEAASAAEEAVDMETATQMAKETMAEMVARNDLLMMELTQHVTKIMKWQWGQVRNAYEEYLVEHQKDPVENPPLDMLITQAVFVDETRDALAECFISILLVLIKGHVYGFACDDLDGMKGWIERRGRKIVCEPGTELAVLPDDPCFSKHIAKGGTAQVLRNIKIESTPCLQPPFWRDAFLPIPVEFVTKGITTQAEFEATYTPAKCAALTVRVHRRLEVMQILRQRTAAEVEAVSG